MVYRAMGLMSGSSLDGLDIVLASFQESSGRWSYEVLAAECIPYSEEWVSKLQQARQLTARDYLLLHTAYGKYLGQLVNDFIARHRLEYQVQLIGSHGHTVFHVPSQQMTAQLGDGAAIAAQTGINVVSELRAMDLALGGQGAPIVPIGEKLLLPDYDCFLNIGGIANISMNGADTYQAFDICPANRVLNMLIKETGRAYDAEGQLAATGKPDESLLNTLNDLEYYRLPFPKSLSNDFGTDVVYPLIHNSGLSLVDQLSTCVEHIAMQVANACQQLAALPDARLSKLLVTGGGAHHVFLGSRIRERLDRLGIETIIPNDQLIDYKEALIMALIAVLRWREEVNVLASVTGASRNSIGGAVWMGQEA